MGVNSLPKTVTRQRRDCDLNPGPSAPESSTLTTRLPSHRVDIKALGVGVARVRGITQRWPIDTQDVTGMSLRSFTYQPHSITALCRQYSFQFH